MPRPYGRSFVFNDVGAWHAKPVLPELDCRHFFTAPEGAVKAGASCVDRTLTRPSRNQKVKGSALFPSTLRERGVFRLQLCPSPGLLEDTPLTQGARNFCRICAGIVYRGAHGRGSAAYRPRYRRAGGARNTIYFAPGSSSRARNEVAPLGVRYSSRFFPGIALKTASSSSGAS